MTDIDRLFTLPELRKAVRNLAEFVLDDQAKPTPTVIDALEVYSAGCRIVNDRLSECYRLVRLGQRSEALRQLQIEPDALNLYKELQFKKQDWLPEVCKDFNLPLPPHLDAEAATRLNEAFSLEQSQAALLREHRLLAISRAPIKRRLDVLRLIQKEDPREVFWQDDIAAYEHRRIDDMRKLLSDPNVQQNWETLQDLYLESSTPHTWRNPFPLDLLDQIKKARNHLLHKAAKREIEPLIHEVNRAITHKQVIRVKNLVGQAKQLQKKYELDPKGSFLAPIRKAEAWVGKTVAEGEDWENFQAGVETLRNAINNGVEWYYVQEYYVYVIQYGWPLPDDVAELFRQRAKTRQLYWIVGGIVGLIVLVAALLLLLLIPR